MSTATAASTIPRITLPQAARALATRWQGITTPAEVTDRLKSDTQGILGDIASLPDPNDLQASITDLQNQLREANTELNAANGAINGLRANLDARDATIATFNRLQGLAPQGERIPDPEKFDGTRANLRTFIIKLRLKAATFTEEQSKLRLAINCLTGTAMDQVQAYVEDTRINLPDLAALITILENAFGNPNKEREAEHKLRTLQQGNREFSAYYAEFQRYAAEVRWDDLSKTATLRDGLSYQLQNDLVTTPDEPRDLAALVALCHRLDTRRRMIRAPHQSQPRSTPRPQATTAATAAPATTTTATGTAPGPMDLSATRRHISPEERTRRMQEGRCYRCGGMGHMARDCPLGQRTFRAAAAVLVPDTPVVAPVIPVAPVVPVPAPFVQSEN